MRCALLFLLLVVLAGCGPRKESLHIYSWAEMFSADILAEFEERYNCRIYVDNYDTNETLFAKLRSGATGYDLIFPTYYYEQILAKQGMLERIDLKRLPNLKNLDRSKVTKIEKSLLQYSVPLAISYSVIGYRKDRVKQVPASWGVFGDATYKGRMTMLNDMRETLGVALIYLGYSINTTNEKELNRAADILLEWKKNLAKFETEQYKNGLATAEFLVVQGNSSDLLQVIAENERVALLLPEQGGIISYDQVAIPLNAPHPDLAYAFINFLYEPAVSASLMEKIFELVPNKAAYPLLTPAARSEVGLFPTQEMMDKLYPLEDVGEAIRLYQDAWNRVKES